MFNGIHTVIFYVSDINKAKSFYRNLGFEIKDDQGEYVSLKVSSRNDILLALNAQIKHRKRVGFQTVILKCDNIEKVYMDLKEKVNITTELVEKPWGKTFIFTDPDENKIEVLKE